MNPFDWLLETERYPARWQCGEWPPAVGWTHIISDSAIFLAYSAMPIALACYVIRRPLPVGGYQMLLWLFVAFIFSCGATHLIDAIIFYHPVYQLSAVVKAVTAVVSLTAAVVLVRLLPRALALPGMASMNHRLQEEVEARKASEEALQRHAQAVEEAHAVAESTAQRLREAQRIARIGDWDYDIESQRSTWSEEMYRLFERDPQHGEPANLAGILELLPPATAKSYRAALDQVIAGGKGSNPDIDLVLPSGSKVWYRVNILAVRNAGGRITGLRGTVQDITERKAATLKLESQTAELETINSELERFAAAASHEMREPLRKISFYGDLLLEDESDRLTADGQQAIRAIRTDTHRMRSQIEALLELARLGRESFPVRPVPLQEIWQRCLEDLPAEQRGFIRITGESLTVAGDVELLHRLFANLLQNALRYRHPHREPLIRVEQQRQGNHVEIRVSDNGLGFPKEAEQRIFDPFERAHGRDRTNGVGMGLAIASRIVAAVDGSIVAQGAGGIDGGACFIVRLREWQGR